VEGAIGLADFLAALRDELHRAADEARTDWLKLGVDELTLTLDVAYEQARSAKGSVKASAKFWVWLSAEAAAEATASGKTTRTHTLTLRLKPRIEVLDASGQPVSYGLDVSGALAAGEQSPTLPPLTKPGTASPTDDTDG
jgi:hypothetical protein